MLEFRADPESPYHDKNFAKDKTVIVYCASGGRSALSGKVLKDMGYERVYNLGAFKDGPKAAARSTSRPHPAGERARIGRYSSNSFATSRRANTPATRRR